MKKSIRKEMKRQMMSAYSELRKEEKPKRLYGVEGYNSSHKVPWDAYNRNIKRKK